MPSPRIDRAWTGHEGDIGNGPSYLSTLNMATASIAKCTYHGSCQGRSDTFHGKLPGLSVTFSGYYPGHSSTCTGSLPGHILAWYLAGPVLRSHIYWHGLSIFWSAYCYCS